LSAMVLPLFLFEGLVAASLGGGSMLTVRYPHAIPRRSGQGGGEASTIAGLYLAWCAFGGGVAIAIPVLSSAPLTVQLLVGLVSVCAGGLTSWLGAERAGELFDDRFGTFASRMQGGER